MPRHSISKQITRQLQEAERVISSARELAEPIAAAIEERLGRHLEDGETPLDWKLAQEACSRSLAASASRLQEVDERHAETEANGLLLRSRRDDTVAELRGELRRVRFYLDERLSKQEATDLFPQRRHITTLDPANLIRTARHLAGLLRGPVARAQPAAAAANLPEPHEVAESLDAATLKVEDALAKLEPELRRRSLAFDEKGQERKEALDSWRRTRDLLIGIYRVAGFDYLADDLRLKRRKKAAEEEAPAPEPPKAVIAANDDGWPMGC